MEGSLSRGPTGDVWDLSPTETSQGRGTRGVTVLTCDHPKGKRLSGLAAARAGQRQPPSKGQEDRALGGYLS